MYLTETQTQDIIDGNAGTDIIDGIATGYQVINKIQTADVYLDDITITRFRS